MTAAIRERRAPVGATVSFLSRAARGQQFRTILAVRGTEVFVRPSACPDSGWLVRATATSRRPAVRPSAPRPLQAAA